MEPFMYYPDHANTLSSGAGAVNKLRQSGKLIALSLLVITTFGAGVSTSTPTRFQQEPKARIFDKFGLLRIEDLKARMDNFAVQLYNEPASQGHLRFQTGRRRPPTEMEELAKTSKDWLVNQRGIDAERIVITNAGVDRKSIMELWIVPAGASPP